MIVWPDASEPRGAAGREALAAEARSRLGPVRQPASLPRVSIVVVNRDGAAHLRRLLAGLAERTDYPDFELVVVDNASTDESVELLRSAPLPFPVSIVANHHNESFSDANNQGAELASGELLLFLNNDTEPFEPGWLRELVACLEQNASGLIGATLVFPKQRAAHGYLVQHRALLLREDPVFLPAELRGHGEDPFAAGFGEDVEAAIPTGACMLIDRSLFERVGGFSHGYVYGGEDIDLGLKVREQGRKIVCCGRSVLIHRFGSTRRAAGAEEMRAIGRRNQRLLWERWGPRLRREYELDLLAGGGRWAAPGQPGAGAVRKRDEILALGFCLKSSEPRLADDPLDALAFELERRGHRHAVLREDAVDDVSAFNYDVVVHLYGPARYIPGPAQLNVLWAPAAEAGFPPPDRHRYQLLFAGDPVGLVGAVLDRSAELRLPTRIEPPQR